MVNGNVCYVLGRTKFSGIFQTRKVRTGGTMSEKSERCLKKRKYDSKYKSE